MAVKIRLKRMGKIRAPYYRVVVMDSRTRRDGRAIEEIGKYHPTEEPSFIQIDSERAQYWLSVGAQPTEQVAALLKVTGDWQKFKGEAGAEGTLKTKAEKEAFVAGDKESVILPEAPKEEAPAEEAESAEGEAEAAAEESDSVEDETAEAEAEKAE
ncbi:30S ribosomal protein S16 [Micrococcus lylae]|uniref:30S ribosomal protein S16 n=1 Tax=Micrococcus lylae TaxID=1273 RepID=UPI0021A93BCD|nr:30S ribosomal protein S16 [Micrococcus lylae]MCT2008449.1 30S ribosomal protein S16 [Micrococcus lylae]MCT2072426.1 30S ribosomal protein S16 [Micrococcus lylae]